MGPLFVAGPQGSLQNRYPDPFVSDVSGLIAYNPFTILTHQAVRRCTSPWEGPPSKPAPSLQRPPSLQKIFSFHIYWTFVYRIPVLPSLHRLIFNAVNASYATDLSGFPKLRELSPTCPHGRSTVQQQSRLRHPYRSVSPLIRPRLNRRS